MIVVDTSAVVSVLVGRPPDRQLVQRVAADGELHAPYLLDVEVLGVLWRLVLGGRLSTDRAGDARTDFRDLAVLRYPHQPLADRVWELRHALSPGDGFFVALAEVLAAPLITTDGRLARASGHEAEVELYGQE